MVLNNIEVGYNFEFVFSTIFLRGIESSGRPAFFISGGLEIFEERQRRHDAGFSFFLYSLPDENRLIFFEGKPPYLMVPFIEPNRLEFYLPPEIKILNHPLFFTSTESRNREADSRENVKVYSGQLDDPRNYRIKKTPFCITEGRLFAKSVREGIDSERQGFFIQSNPNVIDQSFSFATPLLQPQHGLEAFLRGPYQPQFARASSGKLNCGRSFLGKSSLHIPGLSPSSLKHTSHFTSPLENGGFWNLLHFDESTTQFVWLSLGLLDGMAADFKVNTGGGILSIQKEEKQVLSLSIGA